jgi:hypothetical protein
LLNRVPKEYPAVTWPLSVAIDPLPWATSPSQWTDALRVMSSGGCMLTRDPHAVRTVALQPRAARVRSWRPMTPAEIGTR